MKTRQDQTGPRRFFARTRKVARLVIGDPRTLVAWSDVTRNAALIEALGKGLLTPKAGMQDPRAPDGTPIDIAAIAAKYGVEPRVVATLLDQRQHETYRRALAASMVAVVLVLGWTGEMLLSHWQGSQLLAALEFAPFWTFLALVAFQNAWLNWQIRERRLGSARQFVATADSLIPRRP